MLKDCHINKLFLVTPILTSYSFWHGLTNYETSKINHAHHIVDVTVLVIDGVLIVHISHVVATSIVILRDKNLKCDTCAFANDLLTRRTYTFTSLPHAHFEFILHEEGTHRPSR